MIAKHAAMGHFVQNKRLESSKTVITTILSLLFLLSPLGEFCVDAADAFDVEGTVERMFYSERGVSSQGINWFRVSVDDCKAKIRSGGMEDERVEYFEYSCDGTNSSLLINYASPTNSPKRIIYDPITGDPASKQLATAVPNINDAHLILNAGAVPEYVFGLITPVWLAFGSRCFYENAPTNRLEPVFLMGKGAREHGIRFRADWAMSSRSPHLLERMCDFYDGNEYSMNKEAFLVVPLAPPFDQEITNSVYSVITWTNIGAYSLPSKWRVVRYRRNVEFKRLEIESETIGSLKSARAESSVSTFDPTFPKHTRVTDKTVGSLDAGLSKFTYMTLDGTIKKPAELKKDFQFQVASAAARKTPLVRTNSARLVRNVILILLALLSVTPVIVLIWRRAAAGTNKSSPK